MNIAQLNVGYAAHAFEDPRMSPFMDNLDRINALAERAPGFVWRMQSDSGNATDIAVPGDARMISNMSVWEDVESLGQYVFNTVHSRFYERRAEWFEAMDARHVVMWPVPEGHIPTLEEGLARLAHLRANGSSPDAFGWDFVDRSAWRRCDMATA